MTFTVPSLLHAKSTFKPQSPVSLCHWADNHSSS